MTRTGSVGEELKRKSAGYVDRRGWDSIARPLLELDNIFWCVEDDDDGLVLLLSSAQIPSQRRRPTAVNNKRGINVQEQRKPSCRSGSFIGKFRLL